MPNGLIRRQTTGNLHFITMSCHCHAHILETPTARNTLQHLLEETRARYSLELHGYVLMSNHIHLLVAEPQDIKLSTAIQILKQRFSRTRTEEFVWEPRYYDFNVFTKAKRIEKLRYLHRNPVAAGLVTRPEDWPWSSFRAYLPEEAHPVHIAGGFRKQPPAFRMYP